MRSRAELVPLVAALLLAACTAGPPPDPDPPGTAAASPTRTPAAASREATSSPTPGGPVTGLVLPEPGRPFDAPTLLREMRASTRPGGVPEALQTPGAAEAVANSLWTFDGSAWDTFAIGGYCGSASCTLDVAGTRAGAAGEDLWVLEIDPSTPTVRIVSSELRALPAALVAELDELARASDRAEELRPMMLTTARWLPPPDGGRFVLSYRSGGEEGSCAREVTVDAAAAVVVDVTSSGC